LARNIVRMGERKCRQEYWLEGLKARDQVEDPDREGEYSVVFQTYRMRRC
jgi:hypothetical protein